MFKGYNKKDSSGRNMLRIDKRERILGICIVSGELTNDFDLSTETKKIKLELRSGFNEELLDWEISLIAKTGWLKNPEITYMRNVKKVTYRNTNKLRIYNKWLYRNNVKTLKQVLKYMYSPLFASLLLMHKGNRLNDTICIDLNYTNMCKIMLQQWFKDILEINCLNFMNEFNNDTIIFENDNCEKLLLKCKPFISQVPSIYRKFYY